MTRDELMDLRRDLYLVADEYGGRMRDHRRRDAHAGRPSVADVVNQALDLVEELLYGPYQ